MKYQNMYKWGQSRGGEAERWHAGKSGVFAAEDKLKNAPQYEINLNVVKLLSYSLLYLYFQISPYRKDLMTGDSYIHLLF